MPRFRLTYSLILMLFCCGLSAQNKEQKDSLVRLLGCDELQQVEIMGNSYRKALGHARFEHNSTMLLCDTALWNVGANTIKAYGHVKIIQNQTVLSSEYVDYFIDQNLAQFRGGVVQLLDKKKNTLRTRNLDYNTKDSVATFRNGGAFRDKDGQLIESNLGTYDSKIRTFSFVENVNMFTDSVFIKTEKLDYNTGTNIAVFGSGTNAWRDNNMLSAGAGWYNRKQELFLFYRNVHLLTPRQEAWSDSLKYYKIPRNAEMFGHVNLLDTTRDVAAVAGYMYYNDSLSYIKMARNPAVVMKTKQKDQTDTVYVGADTLIYWTVRKCDIKEGEVKAAEKRLTDVKVDAVSEYRHKAAQEAKAAEESAKKKLEEEDPNASGSVDRGASGTPPKTLPKTLPKSRKATGNLPGPDPDLPSMAFPEYSLHRQVPDTVAAKRDTLKQEDSLNKKAVLDTTKIGFLLGLHKVKVFKSDMQVSCDSLAYTDLDSLIRLYRHPVVWNEIKRQYVADSIAVIVKNRAIERASLMSNAFITVQEDSVSFDQVKGTEMMAYFDSTGTLRRFDAMGDASGLFYIEENGALATVNKFESKMLTAGFLDGKLDELDYFETVKSDAYPVVQLKPEEKKLKGFAWNPDKRPKSPKDITPLTPRTSQRKSYEAVSRASFPQTEIYFPGYITSVHKMLAHQDSLKRVRRAEQKRLENLRKINDKRLADSLKQAALDSSKLALTDSLKKTSLDTLKKNAADSLAGKDTLGHKPIQKDTLSRDVKKSAYGSKDIERAKLNAAKAKAKADKKAEKAKSKAQKEADRQDKLLSKEKKWAALDAKDSLKMKAKADKALKKKRAETLKILKAVEKREAKEQKYLDRYKARYEKKKARQDARKAAKDLKAAKPEKPDPAEQINDKAIDSSGKKG